MAPLVKAPMATLAPRDRATLDPRGKDRAMVALRATLDPMGRDRATLALRARARAMVGLRDTLDLRDSMAHRASRAAAPRGSSMTPLAGLLMTGQ